MRGESIGFASGFGFDANHSAEQVLYSDLEVLIRDKTSHQSSDLEWNKAAESSVCISAIQEAERRRIASELHDGLGQILTVLTLELRGAKTVATACNSLVPGLGMALDRACTSTRRAIEELRRSVMNLYPSMLDDLGVVASISAILREAREADRTLRVEGDLRISDGDIPVALRIVTFRIVQEAVNNVLKHARAKLLQVNISKNNGNLVLGIADDGVGISPSHTCQRPSCSGVSGMVRRVHASGGDIQIAGSDGEGTRITVIWNTTGFRQ